jgi:hypothetical protein
MMCFCDVWCMARAGALGRRKHANSPVPNLACPQQGPVLGTHPVKMQVTSSEIKCDLVYHQDVRQQEL